MYIASLDGRDTPPASGKEYVEQLEAKMKELGVGEVATAYQDVIMQWIVIIVGIVWKKLTMQSLKGKARQLSLLQQEFRHLMTMM